MSAKQGKRQIDKCYTQLNHQFVFARSVLLSLVRMPTSHKTSSILCPAGRTVLRFLESYGIHNYCSLQDLF